MYTTRVKPNWNLWPVQCRRCERAIPAKKGDQHRPLDGEGQPWVLCRLCTLREADDLGQVVRDMVSARFPRQTVVDGQEKSINPYPYQILDAAKIASSRAYLVGNEMGTGKTPTTVLGVLTAAEHEGMGVLLVVPSTLQLNWLREIQRWGSGKLDAYILPRMDAFTWPTAGTVLITSYGKIPHGSCAECSKQARALKKSGSRKEAARLARGCEHDGPGKIPSDIPPTYVVADECHKLQRPGTARRQNWDRLRDRVWAAGGRLIGLSGTLVSNTPEDTLELLKAFNLLEAAFDSEDEYRASFHGWYGADSVSQRSVPTGEDRDAVLTPLRRVRVARLRRHVLKHLPPVIHHDPIRVPLTAATLAQVGECVHRLVATRRAWADVAAGLIADPAKYRRGTPEHDSVSAAFSDKVAFYVESRPVVTDEEVEEAVKAAVGTRDETPMFTELARCRSVLATAKIEAATEVVERYIEEAQSLVVFSDHLRVMFSILESFGAQAAVLHGGLSVPQRQELVDRFQRGELRVLGVSQRAGAEGITLTRAGSALFVDWHWNPSIVRQSVDRLNRPGAEIHESIQVMRLEADHVVDRMVVEHVETKLMLQAALDDEQLSLSGLDG